MESSCNDITGDPVRTGRKGSLEKYATGWEAVFGKKPSEVADEVVVKLFIPVKDRYYQGCTGMNDCYHCDGGKVPCMTIHDIHKE